MQEPEIQRERLLKTEAPRGTPIINNTAHQPNKKSGGSGGANYENRWTARQLHGTPHHETKRGMVNTHINSNSRTRICCFNIKRQLVLYPMRNLIASLCAGFIINAHIMTSIVILYEK